MGKENNVKVYWASTTHNRMVRLIFSSKNLRRYIFDENFLKIYFSHKKRKLNFWVKNFATNIKKLSEFSFYAQKV